MLSSAARSSTRGVPLVVALVATAGGCVLTTDTTHLRERPRADAAPVGADAAASDATGPDDVPGALDAGAPDAAPGSDAAPGGDTGPRVDGNLSDAITSDARGSDVGPFGSDGGPYTDVTASPDGRPIPTGPAADMCDGLTPFTSGAMRYEGTTCGLHDDVTLGCNPGSHPDVFIRIDAVAGGVYEVRPSPALAVEVRFNATCDATLGISTCGVGARDASVGGMITIGPLAASMPLLIVVESADPCGFYDVLVARTR